MSINVVNLFENPNVKVIQQKGPFSVLEYQKDMSCSPFTAQLSYFCSEMNVKRRQVVCELNKGAIRMQAGAMQWMAGNVSSTTGVKGAGDFLKKAIGSSVSGEGAIKPEYTGDGVVCLEPTYKYIILEDVASWGGGIVLDDGLFLASETSLEHKVVSRGIIKGIASGEGMFNLCITGQGIVCLESNSPREELIVFELNNDTVKIDGNMAIAWSSSLQLTVERSGTSLIGSAVSGEGLVNVYRGTGKILMAPVTDIGMMQFAPQSTGNNRNQGLLSTLIRS